ncbi:MAG TPA: branched-chain amino acid ABC transporter permease [Anaeromyxobacteraceae bacterium]|nr:branched-chain amino acid ABC transporter permease [Anaeromyxobacteraceae bacterium]
MTTPAASAWSRAAAALRRSARLQLLAFAAVLVAAQLLTRAGGKEFLLTQLTMAGYYTLVVLGLSLLMGHAGQISIGHAGFFAIGGYASAFLTTLDLSASRRLPVVALLERLHLLVARKDLYGGEALGVEPWAAFLVAVGLTALVAVAIGVPVLRLKGHYLAMATLAFGTIVGSVVVGTQRLGAADGISGVPPFEVLPGLRVMGGAAGRVANYYVAWGLVALAMLLLLNLIRSRTGRALRALHGAEEAAAAMGVDVARLKLQVFVLSAMIAGVAGAFLTHFNGGIGPSEASILKSVRYVAIVAVGGMGSLWGTLATSAVLSFLSLRGTFGSHDDAVFGVILVAVMLLAPDGILSADLRALWRRIAPAPRSREETPR